MSGPAARPPEERFWAHVARRGPDECWMWTGGGYPYGIFGMDNLGTNIGAHRYSWLLANGPIPDGLRVCHSCDVPRCVNPAHLWLGTDKDNSDDKIAKGREGVRNPVRGSAHPDAKLTEPQVLEIRRRYATSRVTVRELAAEYGVSPSLIKAIERGEIWTHVPGGDWAAQRRASRPHLTEEAVRDIRRRVAAGETQAALAREYGFAPMTIWGVVTGRSWKHVEMESA